VTVRLRWMAYVVLGQIKPRWARVLLAQVIRCGLAPAVGRRPGRILNLGLVTRHLTEPDLVFSLAWFLDRAEFSLWAGILFPTSLS
jgi:hypothetical protein